MKNSKNSIIAIIISMAIAVMLVYAGIQLINQSNTVYKDSLNYVDKAIRVDSSLKGKIISAPSYATIKDGYTQSLLYFTLAIGVILLAILLPRLQTFSISPTGGINISLKDLQEQVTQLKIQNNELQSKSTDEGGGKTFDEIKVAEVKTMVKESKKTLNKITNDPQKNQWGGKSLSNERRLSAIVRKSPIPSLYEVTLTVTGTKDKPLTGLVNFHLHHTFKNPDPTIAVIDGKAELILKQVYGAFTVGAEADNGVTRLELDLSELKDAPKEFKER